MIRAAAPGDTPLILGFWNAVIQGTTQTFTTTEKTADDLRNLLPDILVLDGAGFAMLSPFRAAVGFDPDAKRTDR